jgi:hypothetical protein
VVTTPPVVNNPPPVTTNPPVTNPPATNNPPPATTPARAPICSEGPLSTKLLSEAFGTDAVSAIGRLYQARNANDTKAKESLTNDIRRLNNLKTRVRPVRPEAAGDDCNWTVVVEFSGAMFAGATTRTWQMTVQLEPASGGRVKSIFSATKQ